jgi:hypothetical protein
VKLSRAALPLLAAALPAAGMPRRPLFRAVRILRISRVVSDPGCAEAFYRNGLEFRAVSRREFPEEWSTIIPAYRNGSGAASSGEFRPNVDGRAND